MWIFTSNRAINTDNTIGLFVNDKDVVAFLGPSHDEFTIGCGSHNRAEYIFKDIIIQIEITIIKVINNLL